MDWDARARGAFRRLAWLALTLLFMPLLPRVVAAQATPPPANTDFEVVEVDLNGQMFNRVLPFDVPFILTGPVPPGIASLEVRCWKLDPDPKSHKPKLLTDQQRHAQKNGNCWPDQPLLVWHNTIDPSAPNPQFRVLAQRLDAENFYQFDFTSVKKITADQAAAFEQKVQSVIDPVLWGDPLKTTDLPLAGDLETTESKAIRDQIIQALQEATGVDQLTGASLLQIDPVSESNFRKDFNLLLRPVRAAQQEIRDSVVNYQKEVDKINSEGLQKIRDNPTLKKLKDALSSSADADAVADAQALPDAPILTLGDSALQSQAALSAFLQSAAPYFSDASGKLATLRVLLASKLTADDGSPRPSIAPLVTAGRLSPADLTELVKMGQPTGLVGSAERALKRASGDLQSDSGVQGALDDRTRALGVAAKTYRARVENKIVVAGSTTGGFATQSNNYISADTGVACAPELSTCSVYVGTNIYLRPINKAAPLKQFGNFFQTLNRRTSFTLGLTVKGIGDNTTREDLFSSQSLVAGIGVRITNSVRLTAGSLVFKKLSPNPLSTDKKLTTTYFLSLSFDIDVVPTLKGIGGILK